jgi:hypothetical protein
MKDINKEWVASEKIRILVLLEFDINTTNALNDYEVEVEAEEVEVET